MSLIELDTRFKEFLYSKIPCYTPIYVYPCYALNQEWWNHNVSAMLVFRQLLDYLFWDEEANI